MEKNTRRQVQHKAKLSAVLGHARVLFFPNFMSVAALTGLKQFWLTNSSFLATFSNSKCYACDNNAVFSEEYRIENIALLFIYLMYANTLKLIICSSYLG